MLLVEETYYYQIKAHDKNQTRLQILQTPGLPIPYVNMSPTGMGICTGVRPVRNEGNPTIWDVTVTYSSDVNDGGSGGNPTSPPQTWIPVRETFLEPYQETLMKSVDSSPKRFTTGAGQTLSSLPSIEKYLIRWDFFQFDPITVTDEIISIINNTINNAPYLGKAKHTLKLTVRKSVVGFFFGFPLRLTEYSLTWKADNWHYRYANHGSGYKDGDGDLMPYIHFKDKHNVVQLGPLGSRDVLYNQDFIAADGLPSGGIAATENKALAAAPGTMYYIERQIYNELNFSTYLRIS